MTSKVKSKSRAKNKSKKHISKTTIRNLIITLIAVIVLITSLVTILYFRKKESDKTVKIAFCGLTPEITENLKKELPELEEVKLSFSELNKNDIDLGTLAEKFDLFFTWEGEITETLGKFSDDIPGKILQTIPTSLRKDLNSKDKKAYPILLNHYEMAFYTPLSKNYNLDYPENWEAFQNYLQEASKHVFTPFFCEGGNDRTLLALVGSIVEARAGAAAYKKLISTLAAAENLEAVIDLPLGECADGTITLRLVLDMLKQWAKDGLVHPLWYVATRNDVLYFMEDKQIAVLFDSLLEHRDVPYSIIKDYESMRVPADYEIADHGVITPAIVCMLLSDNMNNDDLLRPFATEDVQSRLSMLSKLGPTQYRAESYDRQADDVRFWAASCRFGSIPDIALAVYQRSPDSLKAFAQEIRQYLKG